MYRMGQEEINAVAEIIQGKKLWRYMKNSQAELFEKELRTKMGSRAALVTSSGTGALISGLVALGVGPGDEVIVPAYTFISTAFAPLAVGAVPVLAEVDESLTIDPEDVKKKMTNKTKAIMPVHINGLPCNMAAMQAIAKDHGIFLLEDACQSVGGAYQGKRLGTIGEIGAFSFNYFKIISAGEGGALLTNQIEYYEAARIYHDAGCAFFSSDQEVKVPYFAGVNYRMSEVLSGILRVQLNRLDGILNDLRERKGLLIEILKDSGTFELSPVYDKAGDCGLKLGLLFDSYEEVQKAITAIQGLDTGVRVECPYNSDRHVYINWEAVLQKRGAYNEKLNPYGNISIEYNRDMCPKTLEYLQRTLYILIDPNQDLDATKRIGERIKKAL